MILVHINCTPHSHGPLRALTCYRGQEGFAETYLHDLSANRADRAKRADNMQIKIFVRN